MKLRVLTLLGVLALGAGTVIQAQDYDDIYYDGGKNTTEVKKETKKVETTRTRTEVPTQYKVTVQKNYQTDRDVDEYNRRGGIYAQPENDTLYLDAPENEGTFGNTQRIERFYNPDIVVLSDDDELVELYYDNAPTVNLVIGSNYGYTPRFGWGFGNYWPYYAYDPFYDPFWDPWYYSGWYGWHRPYYSWYGWHSPWYYSSWSWGWGWHGGWRGWYDPWARPWGHYGPHMWSYGTIYHNTDRYWHRDNRLPGDHRSLLSGSGSRRGGGFTSNGTRSGVRTAGNNPHRGGTITTGRTRPSTMSGVNTGRTRPSSAVGNINHNTLGGGGGTGYSGGSVRNRGTSSSSYSGSSSSSRSYSPSSTSRSSSYGTSRSSSYGSSRSSGYSGSSSRSSGYSGSSSRSSGYSGGFSGGSRSSGGFSGGSSRSGGGGGGRRH